MHPLLAPHWIVIGMKLVCTAAFLGIPLHIILSAFNIGKQWQDRFIVGVAQLTIGMMCTLLVYAIAQMWIQL